MNAAKTTSPWIASPSLSSVAHVQTVVLPRCLLQVVLPAPDVGRASLGHVPPVLQRGRVRQRRLGACECVALQLCLVRDKYYSAAAFVGCLFHTYALFQTTGGCRWIYCSSGGANCTRRRRRASSSFSTRTTRTRGCDKCAL